MAKLPAEVMYAECKGCGRKLGYTRESVMVNTVWTQCWACREKESHQAARAEERALIVRWLQDNHKDAAKDLIANGPGTE